MNEIIKKIENAKTCYERAEILKKAGLKEYNTSLARGYHTVKGVTAEKYSGRYGEGVKIHANYPQSTRYHSVTYYVL